MLWINTLAQPSSGGSFSGGLSTGKAIAMSIVFGG
jgi:hypothetical protein